MQRYLIATHGELAAGMASAIRVILRQEVAVLCAYTDANTNVAQGIKDWLAKLGPGDDPVIFTDLLGGSVNQTVVTVLAKSKRPVRLFTDISLPFVLEIMAGGDDAAIQRALQEARPHEVVLEQLAEPTDDFFTE